MQIFVDHMLRVLTVIIVVLTPTAMEQEQREEQLQPHHPQASLTLNIVTF